MSAGHTHVLKVEATHSSRSAGEATGKVVQGLPRDIPVAKRTKSCSLVTNLWSEVDLVNGILGKLLIMYEAQDKGLRYYRSCVALSRLQVRGVLTHRSDRDNL